MNFEGKKTGDRMWAMLLPEEHIRRTSYAHLMDLSLCEVLFIRCGKYGGSAQCVVVDTGEVRHIEPELLHERWDQAVEQAVGEIDEAMGDLERCRKRYQSMKGFCNGGK